MSIALSIQSYPAPRHSALSAEGDLDTLRILLVDDHTLVTDFIRAELIRRFQRSYRTEIICLPDLEKALLHIESNAARGLGINLVLLDANMPGMTLDPCNGLNRLRQVMADNGMIHVPVAIISGSLRDEEARRLIRAGAAAYIPKTGGAVNDMFIQIEGLLKGRTQQASSIRSIAPPQDPFWTLTRLRIAKAISLGKKIKEIAREYGKEYGYTPNNVKYHVRCINKRLGVNSQRDAAVILAKPDSPINDSLYLLDRNS